MGYDKKLQEMFSTYGKLLDYFDKYKVVYCKKDYYLNDIFKPINNSKTLYFIKDNIYKILKLDLFTYTFDDYNNGDNWEEYIYLEVENLDNDFATKSIVFNYEAIGNYFEITIAELRKRKIKKILE